MLRDFWTLNTERRADGMTLGRLPWTIVRQYGREVYGFEGRALDHFWLTISTIDAAYLGWQKNEHDRYKRNNAPAPASSSNATGRKTERRTYERGPAR